MNTSNKYIDLCVIEQYADKDLRAGYSLDVDTLPKQELTDIIDRLLEDDTDVREYVLNTIQKLINSRLKEVEEKDQENSGITYTRSSNGDYQLQRRYA